MVSTVDFHLDVKILCLHFSFCSYFSHILFHIFDSENKKNLSKAFKMIERFDK